MALAALQSKHRRKGRLHQQHLEAAVGGHVAASGRGVVANRLSYYRKARLFPREGLSPFRKCYLELVNSQRAAKICALKYCEEELKSCTNASECLALISRAMNSLALKNAKAFASLTKKYYCGNAQI